MSKPSENISPAQLWAEITACPRPHRIIDFPRKRPGTELPFCEVALLVLTPAEQVRAAVAADKYVKAQIGTAKAGDSSKGYDQVYENAAGVETLYQCIRVADDLGKHFFPGANELRDVLTSDEMAVLMQAYADMCSEIGPIVSMLSKDELDAWCDRLEVGADRVSPLYLLSLEAKNQVIRCLGSRLHSSRTASLSQGTS